MRYIFLAACAVMVLKLLTRKTDFYSVGAICHMIYNFHCARGVVFVSSHEVRGAYYYYATIEPRAYMVILAQMLLLFVAMCMKDKLAKRPNLRPLVIDKMSNRVRFTLFCVACLIAWIIMLVNIGRIGVSTLLLDKSKIWGKVSGLYITSNWLGMAVFAYGFKEKHYLLAALGTAPVLLHFFIGSRAYFVALSIVAFLIMTRRISNKRAFFRRLFLLLAAVAGFIFVLSYKRMLVFIKMGEFSNAFAVLKNPETYAYILRLGEPRIVLANLNYIIEHNVRLGATDWFDRIISILPFLNNLIRQNEYTPVSAILRTSMNASYGLASNIWGEFYALGSYPLIAVMYLLWLRMLRWGDALVARKDWTSAFWLPLVAYLSFYIHRLDFVKAVGNAKMVLMAIILCLISLIMMTGNLYVSFSRAPRRRPHGGWGRNAPLQPGEQGAGPEQNR